MFKAIRKHKETLTTRLHEYRVWMKLAEQQTGKNKLDQLREIYQLRTTGGQCGISDYYGYKLYDESYLCGRGKEDFLGYRLQTALSLALNPRTAVLPAWDKCVFTQLADSAGLPAAPVSACFHRSRHISESLGIHLSSESAVREYLRDPGIYPIFAKPAYSQQGYGSAYLSGFDPATDKLQLLAGEQITMGSFLTRLNQTADNRYHKPECGYLFQRCFTVAPEIKAFTRWSAISGVRIICLNGPEGVIPIRALWKVATPPNHIDNFSLGKNGNLLADINLETGEISRLIGGFWPTTEILSNNPISGASVEGYMLPGWDKILEACKAGGSAFPLMKIHHWDFALTDQGPLILELNDLGATEFAQVHGHGLLTPEIRTFLKQHANPLHHPWVRSI
jgi:putative polysaccharide biosynthesis protein